MLCFLHKMSDLEGHQLFKETQCYLIGIQSVLDPMCCCLSNAMQKVLRRTFKMKP